MQFKSPLDGSIVDTECQGDWAPHLSAEVARLTLENAKLSEIIVSRAATYRPNGTTDMVVIKCVCGRDMRLIMKCSGTYGGHIFDWAWLEGP